MYVIFTLTTTLAIDTSPNKGNLTNQENFLKSGATYVELCAPRFNQYQLMLR